MLFLGPFPSKVEKTSRKKILICDPKTGGNACVTRSSPTLAQRAYRRPVTKTEVDALIKFVAMAKAEGQSTEQGIQLAIQAMLVSPQLPVPDRARSRPDPTKPHPDHRCRTGVAAELFPVDLDARRRTAAVGGNRQTAGPMSTRR